MGCWHQRQQQAERARRGAAQAIVVGHSHFIRNFCKTYIPAQLRESDAFAARLVNENVRRPRGHALL